MTARLHAIMQHAHDLDEAWFNSAIEYDVNRSANRRLSTFLAAVPNVEASDADEHVAAVHRQWAVWIGCDPAHGCCQ